MSGEHVCGRDVVRTSDPANDEPKNYCRRTLSIYRNIPLIRAVGPRTLGIIGLLMCINIAVWIAVGIVSHFYKGIAGTGILAWTLGLRHALDADHISAIDLMTRRLVAANQHPVTVGTFFSLGHSTIVIITSVVVAATAASVSHKFDGFSEVGGIVGSSVSTAFLLVLGSANAYILFILLKQLRKTINQYRLSLDHGLEQPSLDFNIEGGGLFFRIFKKSFRLIDRSWKMYPLGVLFGLGFDTSSQVALLGISAVQSAEGRSFWLILIFPLLFTSGMCLVDTTDGALMLSLYTAGASSASQKPLVLSDRRTCQSVEPVQAEHATRTSVEDATLPIDAVLQDDEIPHDVHDEHQPAPREPARPDPLTLLYYNVILTVLTVVVAIVIGVIQLLGLVDSISAPPGRFWDGVREVQDKFDIVGASICGAFAAVGIASVLLHKKWRKWVLERRDERGNTEEA